MSLRKYTSSLVILWFSFIGIAHGQVSDLGPLEARSAVDILTNDSLAITRNNTLDDNSAVPVCDASRTYSGNFHCKLNRDVVMVKIAAARQEQYTCLFSNSVNGNSQFQLLYSNGSGTESSLLPTGGYAYPPRESATAVGLPIGLGAFNSEFAMSCETN